MEALNERIARIEAALNELLPDAVDSRWLGRVAGTDCPEADPAGADAFLEPGRALLRRGGKRWRPLVTVLVCEALEGGRRADVLSSLSEIPHNGSLIVDDIEDASLTRRGGPAIHVEFGTDLAINMGNLMYFLPSLILEKTDFSPEIRAGMLKDWLAVMRRLHLGQGYDILWHRNAEMFPDRDGYLRMCRFKTGSLASLAARLGARAALSDGPRQSYLPADSYGASLSAGRTILEKVGLPAGGEEALFDMLGNAWEDLGTGFQILDDVQNLTSGIPGKDRGDDIVEGKKSLPVILHVLSHPGDGARLAGLFAAAAEGAPKGDWSAVEEAIALLESSGSISAAREEGRALLDNGRGRMISLLPESEARDLLAGIVDRFVEKMV